MVMGVAVSYGVVAVDCAHVVHHDVAVDAQDRLLPPTNKILLAFIPLLHRHLHCR